MNKIKSILKKVEFSKFDFIITFSLILIAVFCPIFSIPDGGNLASAAITVFAIVSGFFIADATSNYLRLQTLISEENAALISIMHTAKTKNKIVPVPEILKKSIDNYMIAQLDVDELDHTVITQKDFDSLINVLDELVIIEKGGGEDDDFVHNLELEKDKMISFNQEIALTAHPNLTMIHWSMLFILFIVVSLTVLSIRDGSLIMHIIAAGMLIGSQGVLTVLRDVDNNRYLQQKLSFRNPQQVFRAAQFPPYYPLSAPKHLRIPDENGNYRIRNDKGEIITITV